MVSSIRDGLHSLNNFASKNVFNTPQRVVAGRVAAGVAAVGSVALSVYMGMPYVNGELSKNVGPACARHTFNAIAMLPESMQFVDATTILKRIECIPKFNESCTLALAGMLGRMGMYVAWFIPTKYLIEKTIGFSTRDFAKQIERDKLLDTINSLPLTIIRDEILKHRPEAQQQLKAVLRRANLKDTCLLGDLIDTLKKTGAEKDYNWAINSLLNPKLQTRNTPLQIDYANHCDKIFAK